MTSVLLPDSKERSLAFYLAMEEYVAGKYPSGDFFFVWRTAPSVIFGRNQSMEAEVNVPYCTEKGIGIYRRKSGGGCVYSDRGNLMHSCVTSAGTDSAFVFSSYMQRIALILKGLGVDAVVSGRNDITVGGYKVSGNAFHILPARCIIHGTLLYDTDIGVMEHAITPSREKLSCKGIASVRQRVANLAPMVKMGFDEFSGYIVRSMCDSSVCLDHGDVADIEDASLEYMAEGFVTGRK